MNFRMRDDLSSASDRMERGKSIDTTGACSWWLQSDSSVGDMTVQRVILVQDGQVVQLEHELGRFLWLPEPISIAYPLVRLEEM